MRDPIMMGNFDHISRANVHTYMRHVCINFVRREVHIIAFVVVSASLLSDKSKKSSDSHQDMMATVDIFPLRKRVNVSKMVKNALFDSRYQNEKR
jgi:hypothetical protein